MYFRARYSLLIMQEFPLVLPITRYVNSVRYALIELQSEWVGLRSPSSLKWSCWQAKGFHQNIESSSVVCLNFNYFYVSDELFISIFRHIR